MNNNGSERETHQANNPCIRASPCWRVGRLGGHRRGSTALALAGVVATYSPLLSAGEKKAVAAFFAGNASFPYKNKISVTADMRQLAPGISCGWR